MLELKEMNNEYLQRKGQGYLAHCCTQCTHVTVLCVPERPSPKSKLQWVASPPHLSESTPEVHGVWAYPLEAALPSKPTK
jgi:hypothetical protein